MEVVSLRIELPGHASVHMKTKYWLHFYIYECCCIRPGPLGCRVGRVVAHGVEGLMAAMWKGVERAVLLVKWVLVVMVGITREIGSVMDTLCGKQRL